MAEETLFITEGSGTGMLRISLSGRLDLETSTAIKPELEATLVAESRLEGVIIDIAGVSYMASTGIGLFVSLLALSRQKGFSFSLRNARPAVMRIIETLGLDGLVVS